MSTSPTDPATQPPSDAAPPAPATQEANTGRQPPVGGAPQGASEAPPTGGDSGKAQQAATETPSAPSDPSKARDAFFAKYTNDSKPTTDTPAPPSDAPATEPPETPDDKAPESEEDDDILKMPPATNEDFAGAKDPGKRRRAYNKARERLAESEPLADLGMDIITTCQAANWDPKDYVRTMQIHAAARRGDPAALAALRQMVGSPAPAGNTWKPEYDDWLTDEVGNGNLSLDMAKSIREKFKSHTVPQQPQAQQQAPQAPTFQPQSQQPAGFTQAQVQRGNSAIAAARERCLADVNAADRQRIDDEAMKIVAKHKGSHPDAWGAIVENAINGVKGKYKAASQAAPIRQTIRPTTQPTTPTAPKSAREAFEQKWFSK